MAIICRLPARGPKLRPIDRSVLNHLGDSRRPMTASEIYAKCGRVYELGVIRAALDRLVALGFASRVDVGGMFKTYAANSCPVCGQFVADLPHECPRKWSPFGAWMIWGELEPALLAGAVVFVAAFALAAYFYAR